MAIELCETHALRRAFGAWQKIVLFLKKQRHRAHGEIQKTLAILSLTFRSWRTAAQDKVVLRHKNILAAKHKSVNQLSTSFLIWHRKVQELKQNHKSMGHLISKANSFIKKKFFGSWVLL